MTRSVELDTDLNEDYDEFYSDSCDHGSFGECRQCDEEYRESLIKSHE